MTDHERLHEQREQEADELERERERLDEHLDEAKAANAALDSDDFIPTPVDLDDEGADQGPPPEAEYPAKD
jgi:hypothetical protein